MNVIQQLEQEELARVTANSINELPGQFETAGFTHVALVQVGADTQESFITWAGWLVPYTTDIYLVTDDRDGKPTAAAALASRSATCRRARCTRTAFCPPTPVSSS